MISAEEKGLALWGGVELDLDVQHLAKKVCACGAPAVVAVRKLDRQERTFRCARCAEVAS